MNFTDNKISVINGYKFTSIIVGMFIEGGAALVILAPLLVPAVKALGVDPLHFGVIFIVNIMIGGLTPPLVL